MRNNMTTEMMNSCRNALSFLAGVDNATMRDVAVMNMRSRFNASQQSMSEVADSICGERAEANEDFSFYNNNPTDYNNNPIEKCSQTAFFLFLHLQNARE